MKDKGIIAVEKSARADLFCLDGNDRLRAAIPNLIVDEPLPPLATPVYLTADRFGTVDKVSFWIQLASDLLDSPHVYWSCGAQVFDGVSPTRKLKNENSRIQNIIDLC